MHIVTHAPHLNAYLVHPKGGEPVHKVKYDDAEGKAKAKADADEHAAALNIAKEELKKSKQEGRTMKTYQEFIAEWNADAMMAAARKNQQKSSKGTYGTSDNHDEDGNPIDDTEKEPVVKKGRGRPAGSKGSGAGVRHNSRDLRTKETGTGSIYGGQEYSLPNFGPK